MTEDSQIAKTPPAPYMITVGLSSTASHYKQQDCIVDIRFFSTNGCNKEIIRKLEKGGVITPPKRVNQIPKLSFMITFFFRSVSNSSVSMEEDASSEALTWNNDDLRDPDT